VPVLDAPVADVRAPAERAFDERASDDRAFDDRGDFAARGVGAGGVSGVSTRRSCVLT
jgi:hypothetical protein